MAVVALYWNIASLPLLYELPEIWRQPGNSWKWTLLAFPIIGVLLVGVMIHQIIQSQKFGQSTLQLAGIPGVVGGQLAGVVRIPTRITAEDGFHLKLNCFTYTRGADNKQHEELIWQDEGLVTEPMHDNVTNQTVVPVLFAIPFEAMETSRPDSKLGTKWRLDVSCKLPGVDYKSQFEVPVFKTAESRAGFQLDPKLAAQYTASANSELPLHDAGIEKKSLADGSVTIEFPAARNWPTAMVFTAIAIVVGGVLVEFGPRGMPLFVQIIIGLFELVFVLLALNLWFYRSMVQASSAELILRGGLFGLGRTRSCAADEIQNFATVDSMSSGASVWKNIDVVLRNGQKWTIGKGISSKLAQQAVIDSLSAALHCTSDADGRK